MAIPAACLAAASDGSVMLQFFRNFFKSKVGIAVTLGFLALIALAFASADISGSNQFGGVAGGDRAAMVGDEKIDTGELSRSASQVLERVRQDQPTMTMPVFLKQGGLEKVLDDMIDRYAVYAFGKATGMRAGDRLIDSEIAQIPAFRGPDGKFSDELFRQLIQQQGYSEQMVRDDLGQSLMARQVMAPVAFAAVVPKELVLRYAALLKETRHGAIAMLPSNAYAPAAKPTDAEVAAYYAAHRSEYTRPERRVIRYASFGEEAVGNLPAPTDAEIAARYKRDAAQYAPSEKRGFTQLVAATKPAAEAIRAEVAKGKSLQAVAAAKGLATTRLTNITKAGLASNASQAVANAGFAAAKGAITAPVQGGLGWYILAVDSITASAGRTLEQARPEIHAAIAAEKRRAAIADLGATIEEQIDNGSNLNDIAKQLKVTLQVTKPLTAGGIVYGSATETAPPLLARALSTAFSMEEGEPQVTEIEPGKTFLVFEASEITPSAPAPLKEIREQVVAEAILAKGALGAKAAADRVLAKVRKGTPLAAAIAAEGKPLPPPQSLAMGREQLSRMDDRIPPPLALFFSMAEGTAKRLKAEANAGWFVVQLTDIEPGKVVANDPILAQASQELGQLAGDEYEAQFRAAVRAKVGVERNPTAIAAVRRRLAGEN